MDGVQMLRRSIKRMDDQLLGGRLHRLVYDRREAADTQPLVKAAREREYHAQQWWHEVRPHTLKELCDKYGTDKGSNGDLEAASYWWPPHTYVDVYATLFDHFRNDVRLVFECGIGSSDETVPSNMTAAGHSGASLRMWRDYFPNAHVFGADVDPKALFEEDRIKTFEVDQTDSASVAAMWEAIGKTGFDLIVDDGLHEMGAGVSLFEASIDRLKPGGLYVIEDISPDRMGAYMDYFAGKPWWVSYALLRRPYPARYVDNGMVLIRAPH